MTDDYPSPPAFVPAAPPMPFGFALARVFRILRGHWKLFVAIAAPPAAGVLVLYAAMGAVVVVYLLPQMRSQARQAALPHSPLAIVHLFYPLLALGLLAMVPMLALGAFYLGAAFHAANKIDSGVRASVGDSYREGWRRLGRSLGLLCRVYFRAFGPMLAIEAGGFALSGWSGLGGDFEHEPAAAFALLALAYLLLMASYVYGIVVSMRLSLSFAAQMEEGLTASEAVARSSRLTAGNKGRIFLLLLVTHLIGAAVLLVFEMAAMAILATGAVTAAALHLQASSPPIVLGVTIAGLCAVCFLYLWCALIYGSFVAVLSIVYHDQRRRLDGPWFSSSSTELSAGDSIAPPGAEPA